ncbi:MAG: dephospho-CoA kinase [Rhodococcus sp.]|nr:dephospho-CoA kinase [Rhodococcus sp. (in: high G+C Gram-positive bacteria)]
MLRVGLTGGIGAGKSTASKELAALGAVIVDADLIAREVVEPGTEGLAALTARFGETILADDGSLNRPALAAVAFADEESRTALNSILHPLIGQRTAELLAQAPADAIVVQDIPLIVENSMAPAFQLVAIVFVDEAERLRRLTDIRGMDEADARARIAAQASDEQRIAVADVRLDNNAAQESLVQQVQQLWHKRLVPFEKNLRERTPIRPRPIVVEPTDQWTADAARLIPRLWLTCGASALRIDHIGSTAVPELPAVDAIDIQITVADLDVADALADALASSGFPRVDEVTAEAPKPEYVGGEVDPALWDIRLHASADPGRPAYIHVRVVDTPGQRFALLLRDWLREDVGAREEYAALKRAAAARISDEMSLREAAQVYSDGKAPWFDHAFARANTWAQEAGWRASAH